MYAMISRPVAECLMRIRNGQEFSHLVAWLKTRAELARDDCTKQSGDALLRAQGRAQDRMDLLNLIEAAPGILEKVQDQ